MKNVWNRRALAALAGVLSVLFFVTSCEDDLPTESSVEEANQITPDIQRKINFIRSTGFEEDSITYWNGDFHIGHDIMISEADVNRRMKALAGSEGTRTTQRQGEYLVDLTSVTNIRVAFINQTENSPAYSCNNYPASDQYTPLNNDWKQAFRDAMVIWNDAGSLVNFVEVSYNQAYDIKVYAASAGSSCRNFYIAAADLPLSNNKPGARVYINSNFASMIDPYNTLNETEMAQARLNTAIHELGHTIGLTHSDEEKVVNGQVVDQHIGGTAGLGQDPTSIMNATSNASNPPIALSYDDKQAVRILYPVPSAPLTYSLRDDYKLKFTLDFLGDYDYVWHFGDGNTRTTTTNSTTYQYVCTTKDYTMRVYAIQRNTGTRVAEGTITAYVKQDGGGVVPFEFSSRLIDDYRLKFSAQGGEGCYPNRYFHWDFGDGISRITSSRETTHQYPSGYKYYTVTVSTKDSDGNLLAGPINKTVLSKRD